jgi:hypothetical protein
MNLQSAVRGGVIVVAAGVAIFLLWALRSNPATSSSSYSARQEHAREVAREAVNTRLRTFPDTASRLRTSDGRLVRQRPKIDWSRQTSSTGLAIYLIDDFGGKNSLPAGYSLHNIAFTTAGITLAQRDAITSQALGVVESPALPLVRKQAENLESSRKLPPGSELTLELSYSEDGKEWSDFAIVDRQAGGSPRAIMRMTNAADGNASSTASLPEPGFVKYRLSLQAEGEQFPVVTDLRLWRTSAK